MLTLQLAHDLEEMVQRLLCAAPPAQDHKVSRARKSHSRARQAAASSAAWSAPISERCGQSKVVFRMARAASLRSSSAYLRFWARVIAKTPLAAPDCLAPDRRQ